MQDRRQQQPTLTLLDVVAIDAALEPLKDCLGSWRHAEVLLVLVLVMCLLLLLLLLLPMPPRRLQLLGAMQRLSERAVVGGRGVRARAENAPEVQQPLEAPLTMHASLWQDRAHASTHLRRKIKLSEPVLHHVLIPLIMREQL